ncbi:hypothetical protein ACHAW6_014597 [Cyclotella cf. meneghiniana]
MFVRPLKSTIRRPLTLRPRLASPLQSRFYLGDAGQMKSRRDIHPNEDAVARREQALWEKARPRYESILERHLRLPSLAEEDLDDATDTRSREEKESEVRKKRLVYRAKQRGWLEVDLLLGTWANQHVPTLTGEELDQFEKFVNLETIDIYNVLTLRTDVPEDMKSGGREKSVVERIQEWAKESPLGKADREKYVEVKRENNLI